MSEIKLVSYIEDVEKALDDIATKKMMEACLYLQGKVQETLSGTRTGREYKVPGTKHKRYIASAPGEPPAVATGRLRRSIKFRVEGGFKELQGVVGTKVEYAEYLEKGTVYYLPVTAWIIASNPNSSAALFAFRTKPVRAAMRRMAPRPFLRPTFERERLKVKEILARRWL